MDNNRTKYPRTPHLSWSEGASIDDILLTNEDMFKDKQIIVTEKMDGENTTMTSLKVHARSPDSRDHPSRHLIKSMWSQIKHKIPEGMRICGENLSYKHSIGYDQLPSFFLVFAVFDEKNCLSWKETMEWCKLLGFHHVPILYNGSWDKNIVMQCYTKKSNCGGIQEGYVVRNTEGFPYDCFSQNVAKFVRKEHVQTDEHWMNQKLVPNRVKS